MEMMRPTLSRHARLAAHGILPGVFKLVEALMDSLYSQFFRWGEFLHRSVCCFSVQNRGVLQLRVRQRLKHLFLGRCVTPMIDVLFKSLFMYEK